MNEIRTWQNVDQKTFGEIRVAGEPAILKGIARHWPLVSAAVQGDRACADYLLQHAAPRSIQYLRAGPDVEGRFHYGADLTSKNFKQESATLTEFLAFLMDAPRDAFVAQGLLAQELFRDFAETTALPILPGAIEPRIWIGNAAKVAVHNDPAENVACVAAGQRRFTLFPPEQVSNLYMGPFHITPAGVQVSMVHVTAPDFGRFPRFAEALAASYVADLEPGDGLYIPYHWYHHVEAIGRLNVLVNFWWDPARKDTGSPWDALMHGMMTLRTLPPEQRRAWRAMFDYYVFLAGADPRAHISPEHRGILDATDPKDIAQMRNTLLANLRRGS